MFKEKICRICGSKFEPKAGRTLVCSNECRNKQRALDARNWRIKNPEKAKAISFAHLKYNRERLQRMRQESLCLIGTECVLCKRKENIRFHETNFEKHEKNPKYILKNPELFSIVCQRCHLGVHFLHEVFGLSWIEILDLRR